MDEPEFKIPFEDQLFGLSFAVTGIVGITGNLLCLKTFWVERRNSYFHIQLLAANILHLLSVVLAGPSSLRGRWLFGDGACRWYGAHVMAASLAELFFTVIVCLEAYMAVCHRFYYENQSKITFARISACVWLVSLVLGLSPLLGWNRYLRDMPAVICGMDTVNRAPLSQAFLAVTRVLFVGGGLLAGASVVLAHQHSSRESHTFDPLFSDKQLVKICGLLLLTLVLCDLPYFARMLCQLLNYWSMFRFRSSVEAAHVARQLGSCLHPWVYLSCSRDFRHLAQSMVTGYTPEKKNQ